jgi:phage shock protein A
MTDTGLAMQRAQDKIAQMQARAGAVDELLASGTLTDLSGSSDPLQAELDKTSRQSQIDLELAQMKGALAPPAPTGALSSGTPAASQAADADDQDEAADAETVEALPTPAAAPTTIPAASGAPSDDLFSLGGQGGPS